MSSKSFVGGIAFLVLGGIISCNREEAIKGGVAQQREIIKNGGADFVFKNPKPLDENDVKQDRGVSAAASSFIEGAGHYYAGRRVEAETALKNSVESYAHFSDSHYYLGLIHKEKGDLTNAVKHLEDAVNSFCGHLEAHLSLADVYLLQSNLDKARKHFTAAREIFSFDSRAYVGLGRVAFLRDELDDAQKMAEAALEYDAFSATAYQLLGDIFLREGNEFRSFNYYKQAKTIDPLCSLDENIAAGENKVLDVDPKSVLEDFSRFNLEVTLSKCTSSVAAFMYATSCGDVDEAIRVADTSLRSNPFNTKNSQLKSEVSTLKASRLVSAGKYDEAVPYLEEGIARDVEGDNKTSMHSSLLRFT